MLLLVDIFMLDFCLRPFLCITKGLLLLQHKLFLVFAKRVWTCGKTDEN